MSKERSSAFAIRCLVSWYERELKAHAPSDLDDEDVQWAIKEARTTADEIDGLREKAWKYDELCK